MSNNRCNVCGNELTSKRKDAKFCSPKCRKDASRISSIVTDNVTLNDPVVTLNFRFTTPYSRKPGDAGYDKKLADDHAKARTATVWYDVPIAAQPIVEKGNPEMPDYMNGRQYFLWQKNGFDENKHGAVIRNPFTEEKKQEYMKAGEGSRRWGTV